MRECWPLVGLGERCHESEADERLFVWLARPPVPELKMDQLGQAVWDDLQAVVEERLKAEPKETSTGKAGVEVVVPDDVYA
jgi:hypothetical protein